MMVHEDGGETDPDRLLRRRARAGRDRARGRAGPGARPLRRRDGADVLRRPGLLRRAGHGGGARAGAASASARCRSPTWSGPAMRLAREGAPVNAEQAYILDILEPIHERLRGHPRALRAGRAAAARGRRVPLPGAGRGARTLRRRRGGAVLPRRGRGGAERLRRRAAAARSGPADLAAYEAIEREPIRAPFRGTEVLTNPPPSSGGILIAYCLGLLERLGERSGPEQLVAAMGAANDARGEDFAEALYGEGLEASLLDPAALDLAAGDLLGSTTHISVLDGDGMCASVTCSNGSGSGVLVPGHRGDPQQHARRGGPQPARLPPRSRPGRRVPSMMAPTVVLRDGEIELGLGSAGSNRIRSAILQTIVRVGRAGDERRRGGAGAAAALRAGDRPGRAGDRRGGAGADRGARHPGRRAGPQINLFFGGVPGRRPRSASRARSAAAATRAAAARRRRMSAERGGSRRSTSRPRGCSTGVEGEAREARLRAARAARRRRRPAGGAARGGRRRRA